MTDASSERDVDQLLRQLTDGDVMQRIEAAEFLVAHGGDARVVPALRAALADEEGWSVTEAAMNTLLTIDTPAAADALIASLNEDDEETTEHLAMLLSWAASRGWVADDVLRRSGLDSLRAWADTET